MSLITSQNTNRRRLRERFGLGAFSLTEVVIAVGIVAAALLSIVGLLGASLVSSSETVSAREALGVRDGVSDYLNGKGYAVVKNWFTVSGSNPRLYAYAFSGTLGYSQYRVREPADSALIDDILPKNRGRLYAVELRLSPNPTFITSGTANLTSANLDPAAAGLAIQANISAASGIITGTAATNKPTTSYDLVVFR